MKQRQLTISRMEPNGSILWLSDGGKYLIQREHHPLVANWRIGESVQVMAIDYPPDAFQIQSESGSDTATAIFVRQ